MSKAIKVANADGMDGETFAKHFTHRHSDQLAGSKELRGDLSEEMLELHKVFHRKIHELTIGLDHEHLEAKDG